MITKICLHCQQEFQTRQTDINRGHGKFCSKKCSGIYNRGQRKPNNQNCSYCNKSFRATKFRISQSKSGQLFCSRICKDNAQLSNQGSEYNYRDFALRNYPNKCNRCQYQICISILQVHHIDHNRSNNELSNLEILCPNCHAIEHLSK